MLALYIISSAILVSGIAWVTFTNESLSRHCIAILYICGSSFFALCVITLSKHCSLRRNKDGILETVATLCEPDAEPDDEQETHEAAPDLQEPESFIAFCKRRPMYGIAVFTCAVFVIISLYLFYTFYNEDKWRMGSDSRSAVIILNVVSVCVFVVVLIVAYYEKHEGKMTDFSHNPFDENIEIPMKVYVPKIVAVLMTGKFNIIGCYCIQFVFIILLAKICNLSDDEVTEYLQGSKMNHTILICISTYFNFVILLCLIVIFSSAHKITKNYLLGTFENNWQQNLVACELLLPEIEVNNLEDLRIALLEKMNDPELTDREKKIVDYLRRPWWKTKRCFVVAPEEVDQAEILEQDEDQNQQRPQNPTPEPDGTPSPEIRRPMTRSRARRQQQ